MEHKKKSSLTYRVPLFFFFLSPLLMILAVYNTVNSHASSIFPAEPENQAVSQWQKTPAPQTDAADPATPVPLTSQETQTWVIYLPVIHKSRILSPDYGLIAASGPVINPRPPGQVAGGVMPAQDTPQIPPSPTPSQPTATPGGQPTPGAGTPTWTPTSKPTFTATPMPTATPKLIPYGDLESNRHLWRQYSYLGYTDGEFFPDGLFFDSEGIPEAPPKAYDGDWYAWLGGDSGEISYIERQLTVPDPGKGEYRRYWLAHLLVRQSYDIACANDVYSFLGSPQREEFLSGHLTYATPATLDQYGVDLGGMLVCVNKPGAFGCNEDAVENVLNLNTGQTKKAIFVSYYELCQVANGTGWYVFLFPISNSTDYPNLLFPSERFPNVRFSDGSTDLAGKTITLQIKAITDPDAPDENSSSSVLVDDVMWFGGPPLPTPTPKPFSAGLELSPQNNPPAPTATATALPIVAPHTISTQDTTGAYFLPVQLENNLSTTAMPDNAFLKKNR